MNPSPEDSPVQDLSPLVSERVGMESFKPLLESYVGSFIEQAEKIDLALEQANPIDLRTVVHQLKGTGGGYGYPELTRVAAICEQALVEAGPEGTRDKTVLTALHELLILMRRARAGLDQS